MSDPITFGPTGRPDLRTAQADNAILDALIRCCRRAPEAGVDDDHVRPLDTMRLALIGARRLLARALARGEEEPAEAMATAELVMRGVEATAYYLASRRIRGVPDASPQGVPRSGLFTLASTARAYLIGTEMPDHAALADLDRKYRDDADGPGDLTA